MFEQGLLGQGEVVAAGDTGIDIGMCFFHDALHPVPMWPQVNPQHRKIVSYRKAEPSDPTFDLAEGHGTAVAGCIAGDAQPAAADDDSVEQVLRLSAQSCCSRLRPHHIESTTWHIMKARRTAAGAPSTQRWYGVVWRRERHGTPRCTTRCMLQAHEARIFNGMAPKAKLAFHDIASEQDGDSVFVPDNLNTKYFPWACAPLPSGYGLVVADTAA